MKTVTNKLRVGVFLFCVIFSPIAFSYDPMDCLNDAVKAYPKITNGIVTKLCANSSSSEPVKCFLKSADVDDGITIGLSAELCSRTTSSDKTLLCYSQASGQGYNRGQGVRLCSGNGSVEPSKCTANISKVDSDITRGIAVDVCSWSTNANKTISCYGEASATLNRGLAVTLCSAKPSSSEK